MSPLTIPRKAASLQYKLVRLPYTVIENQFVAKLLAQDSRARLAYERALGSLDERAGRLLGDSTLQRRGETLRRRSDILGTATTLEAKAEARKEEAAQKLTAEKEQAAQQRAEARTTQAEGARAAREAEREEKERIASETEAREKAEKERVEREAGQRTAKAKQTAAAQKKRIAAQEKADTAAPKAQLEDAAELSKGASKKRSQAERLGELADVEAKGRKAEREAANS